MYRIWLIFCLASFGYSIGLQVVGNTAMAAWFLALSALCYGFYVDGKTNGGEK